MRLDETPVGQELPLAMNRAPTRRVPLASRHLQEITTVEREHGLDEPLAEARRADDERTIMILQRSSHDLRRRCRTAVDENDERDARRDVRTSGTGDFR